MSNEIHLIFLICKIKENEMMKKKMILIAAISLSSMTATAQTEVGKFSLKPVAGITISDVTVEKGNIYNSKVGFTGGVEVEYGISTNMGVLLGVLYTQQGGKYKETNNAHSIVDGEILTTETVKYKLSADYVNLPLLANFYVWRGLAIKTGVQMGILVNDKWTYRYDFVANYSLGEPYYIPGKEDGSHTRAKMTDFCKGIDFGIPVGLSYEYKNICLDARYYFGLTNMNDDEDTDVMHNRVLSITLGYKFKL